MDPNTVQALGYFFAAVPGTVMATAALVSSLVNGRKADVAAGKVDIATVKLDDATAKAELNALKTDQVIATVENVHQAVNGGWADMKAKILSLENEIVDLKDQLAHPARWSQDPRPERKG